MTEAFFLCSLLVADQTAAQESSYAALFQKANFIIRKERYKQQEKPVLLVEFQRFFSQHDLIYLSSGFICFAVSL